MSMFGAKFIREAHRNLSVSGKDPPEINYNPQVKMKNDFNFVRSIRFMVILKLIRVLG